MKTMKTELDIVTYILNDWFEYIHRLIETRGVSAVILDLTEAERTALAMYEISANCFT